MTEQIQATIKLTLVNANVFSDAISAISKLVNETNITVTPDHLEIVAMDPANVALVRFKMDKKEFVGYDITEETKFAINIPNLKQVLARIDKKDSTLTLAVVNNQLEIVGNGKTKKKFTLPLIELEEKQHKMPELKFLAEISIEGNELSEAIADVAIISEACEFKVTDKKFVVAGAGDLSKANSETKCVVHELEKDKKIASKYAIEYLDKMMSVKFAKNSKLFLGTEYPMKLSYMNESGSVSIEYLLAPRINNE